MYLVSKIKRQHDGDWNLISTISFHLKMDGNEFHCIEVIELFFLKINFSYQT